MQILVEKGLAFDDVLLRPGHTTFTREDIDLTTRITPKLSLAIPIVSSPMDTVTGHRLAIALAELGGIGIIHRNLPIENQADEVRLVRAKGLIVGAATGVGPGYHKRVEALVEADVSVIVVDSAHGDSSGVLDAVRYIKKQFPHVEVIGGNVATKEGANNLIEAGVDGLRVGMGPGSICTTRVISGMGVPQFTAICDTSSVGRKHNIPVIADGGIKHSGDIVKALAGGASAVMMGSFLAAVDESLGEVVELHRNEVPARFKSILSADKETYSFKRFRAMGSTGAMKEGARVLAEDEFHGKSYFDSKVLVAEGVESLVPSRGSLKSAIEQTAGGLRSGMFYVGARTVDELFRVSVFLQITSASLVESHPHDVFITNPGDNYAG